MEFKINDIQPNPFRHIAHYPIKAEKVAALCESLRTTGYWGNIVARKHDGKAEIAYGHHRLIALKKEYGPDEKVDLIIRDLSDKAMLQIMARENMEEWGTSASVEHETIRAVVEAYADGKIELDVPVRAVPAASIRYAPSFVTGDVGHPGGQHPYTAQTLAPLIGWLEPSGKPQQKIHDALAALQFIEEGLLREADFEGLTTKQAQAVVEQARKQNRAHEQTARVKEKEAEEASAKADAAGKRGDKREQAQQIRASRHLKAEATKEKAQGRRTATAVGRAVSKKIKAGEIGYKGAAQVAASVAARTGEKVPPDIEPFTAKLTRDLHAILDPERDPKAERLAVLVKFREHLSEAKRADLVRTLETVKDRIQVAINALRGDKKAALAFTSGKTKGAA